MDELDDLDQVTQVIGYHPQFHDHFLRTQNFIMKGDGPLPNDYRYYLATKSGPKIRNLCLKGSLQTAQKPSHAHHAHSRFQFYNFCSEQGISIAKFCFLEFNLHMPPLHLLPENGMDHVSYTQCVCCKLHLNFNYLWVGFQVMQILL